MLAMRRLFAALADSSQGQSCAGCAGRTAQNLLAGSRRLRKRVVVRNTIAAVFAHRAGARVLVQIGNDAHDLADHGVEPLRVRPYLHDSRLAGGAIADVDIEHPPVGVAALRRRIEHHLAELMAARVEPHAENLARRAFERTVRRIRIGPLDQHALMHHRPRRRDRCGRFVALRLQTGEHRVLRYARRLDAGILHVRRIELAVLGVVGIEVEPVDPVPVARQREELLEEPPVPPWPLKSR